MRSAAAGRAWRLLAALVTLSLIVSSCAADDDSGAETADPPAAADDENGSDETSETAAAEASETPSDAPIQYFVGALRTPEGELVHSESGALSFDGDSFVELRDVEGAVVGQAAAYGDLVVVDGSGDEWDWFRRSDYDTPLDRVGQLAERWFDGAFVEIDDPPNPVGFAVGFERAEALSVAIPEDDPAADELIAGIEADLGTPGAGFDPLLGLQLGPSTPPFAEPVRGSGWVLRRWWDGDRLAAEEVAGWIGGGSGVIHTRVYPEPEPDGESNLIGWLETHGFFEAEDAIVDALIGEPTTADSDDGADEQGMTRLLGPAGNAATAFSPVGFVEFLSPLGMYAVGATSSGLGAGSLGGALEAGIGILIRLPVGSVLVPGGLLVLTAAVLGILIGGADTLEAPDAPTDVPREEAESPTAPPPPPRDESWRTASPSRPAPDFTDPSRPPGDGWEWRGPGLPGTEGAGAWWDPSTTESLYPHFQGKDHDPHYDYKPKRKDRHGSRWYEDDSCEPKGPRR